MAAHQALPSLGFSRQEHWSGLPFLSPMNESEKWKWSRSVMSDSSRPHGLQHARIPCPSSTRRACSNSCPLSQWCHPTISSFVVPFSSCLQFSPALESFKMSQFFTLGGQIIGVSASTSVLPSSSSFYVPYPRLFLDTNLKPVFCPLPLCPNASHSQFNTGYVQALWNSRWEVSLYMKSFPDLLYSSVNF